MGSLYRSHPLTGLEKSSWKTTSPGSAVTLQAATSRDTKRRVAIKLIRDIFTLYLRSRSPLQVLERAACKIAVTSIGVKGNGGLKRRPTALDISGGEPQQPQMIVRAG